MVEKHTSDIGFSEAPVRASEWRRFRRVFFERKLVTFGLVVLVLMVIAAAFAPLLTPYDPYELGDAGESLLQPGGEHLLGTDLLGRDTLSRLIYGARTALMVGFISVFISGFIGVPLGIIAGYFGGVINMVIMRAMDAIMCFPMLLLALLLAAVLREYDVISGIWVVIIALSIAIIPGYARVTHGVTLSIKENEYIMAQRAMGSSNMRVMFRHILPNAFPPLIVLVTMQLGALILAEAGLSFLGIGIDPPGAAWGAMVWDGYRYLANNTALWLSPGIAIALVVFAFNMVGDGLRDALDPRLRGLL
ncbi:MAG TPA: ABC transporter permease [Dehalococcoidia bacterium]|nr:ABC transporter permease [Dehalococcoidia bacterium]